VLDPGQFQTKLLTTTTLDAAEEAAEAPTWIPLPVQSWTLLRSIVHEEDA
jgi:hypothetical protein